MARHSSLWDARRWKSSIAADDFNSDDEDDDYYGNDESIVDVVEEIFIEDSIEEEIVPVQKSQKKKKLTKRQKRKQSLSGDLPLDVKFLHFRDLENGDSDTIQKLEDDFDRLAFDNDLSKFKWISMLEKSLVLKLRQEQEESAENADELPKSKKGRKKRGSKNQKNDQVRDYWKVALKAANNKKKVPEDLKEHFLKRMVVGAFEPNPFAEEGSSVSLSSEDHREAHLLARGRELAVDNPLLWRRYSAKERKLRVRLSKKVVEKRADDVVARMDSGMLDQLTPLEETILSATEDRSTSLEYYLRHVRIPALNKLHHDEKTADQREQEALQFQQLLKERLPKTSYQKMIALVQTYVECFSATEEKRSDGNGTRLVNLRGSPLTPMPDGIEATKEQQKAQTKEQKNQQKQFRVLLSNLRKALPQGRIHWIGQNIADFFYVTTPDEVDLKNENTIAVDPILRHSEANWKETRDQYVQSFLNVHKLFLELEKEQDEQRKLREAPISGSSSPTLSDLDELIDPNEDPSSEKSVLKTFDTVAALSRMDAKKITTQRVKPRTYIPLEAMGVGDTWKSPSSSELSNLIENQNESSADNKSLVNGVSPTIFDIDSFPIHPPVDRLVIVDNLPIDISEFRLREAFGRCGDIENIAIFHSRPDLDPGRRATDAAKKIRNPSSSSRRQKWTRPRTPLYAMILYNDAIGAQKASCDPLRLFGMVLDQHLMRSHRASDMRTLYLEDVPWSIQTMEFELGQLLEASDLYVCLNDSAQHLNLRTKAGRYSKNKKNNKSNQLLSYTIRFPSFEAAYWSYWKLSRELPLLQTANQSTHPDQLEGPALHWMDTPRDSHLYWTRKLNF